MSKTLTFLIREDSSAWPQNDKGVIVIVIIIVIVIVIVIVSYQLFNYLLFSSF